MVGIDGHTRSEAFQLQGDPVVLEHVVGHFPVAAVSGCRFHVKSDLIVLKQTLRTAPAQTVCAGHRRVEVPEGAAPEGSASCSGEAVIVCSVIFSCAHKLQISEPGLVGVGDYAAVDGDCIVPILILRPSDLEGHAIRCLRCCDVAFVVSRRNHSGIYAIFYNLFVSD